MKKQGAEAVKHHRKSIHGRVTTSPVVKLFYISLALLALALLSLVAALWVQHETVRPAIPAAGYSIGTDVPSGLVTLRVAGSKTTTGTGHSQAPAGQQYVVVTLVVRNNSDHTIQLTPSTDTYVKDSAGNVSYLSPFSLDKPFHAGGLASGETVQGELSYLTTKTTDLKFFVDGIWSGGIVPFKVQSK